MTVYVDTSVYTYGRMVMCHMLADTKAELFGMAVRIGVNPRWYQGFEKASCPHFDIAKSKRALAVENGAVEVNRKELVVIMKKIKDAALLAVREHKPHGWEP